MAKESVGFYLTLVAPPDLFKLQSLNLLDVPNTWKLRGCYGDVSVEWKLNKTLPAVALSLMKMIAVSGDVKTNIVCSFIHFLVVCP